jgi:hypothetical protein
MERTSWNGFENSRRLTNGTVEVVVTADVGPRVVVYGFAGETNVLGEALGASKTTRLGVWHPLGGHRLWAAPESLHSTYAADNDPVEVVEELGGGVRFTAPDEPLTGIRKDVVVRLAPAGTEVTLLHRITNVGVWPLEIAPWAITVLRGGGVAIVPQEPYAPHGDGTLLPSRVLSLWSYSDLSDPRFAFSRKYMRVRSDVGREAAIKVGVSNGRGWAAYLVAGVLFVKRFSYEPGAPYPDNGCNNEIFTAGAYMELESLAPIRRLEPGAYAEHVERWSLHRAAGVGESDDDLDGAFEAALEE